ncbi:LysR substrate-binding domain-containing protein [Aquamicrobium sp. LC103]|uniref:LysR substrate-binding domain-containing protein n=1 Tax=Aquamicrobium sp. LC103 TaxID=1120658 RepID=UPI00063E98F0|nr:LysR substrate-binding domain-containing protein [Aquamicrobium sp. LC103]TKT78350.1 LysR family transcriptional regulator [Aquamicrobium sp. LC103]
MKHGIELRHIAYFACLAEELHFGRAAERLGIAQAPLSQQIKQLEGRLGTKLFHRTTRRVRLTSAGETFLWHAQEVLNNVDRAVSHTRAISGEQTGRIVVGGVHIAMSHFLPPIIAAFRRSYPAVIVDVMPLGTAEQLRTLESGKINIAFIRPTSETGFMQMEVLANEGFVAVLPRSHPLAAKADLSLRDFAGESMVAYAPILGASYNSVVMEALRAAGVHPMIVQEGLHTLSVTTLVAAGVGIAVVPSWVQHMVSPYLVYRPLVELPKTVELAVAWPAGETSAVVLDFISTSRRVVKELTQQPAK